MPVIEGAPGRSSEHQELVDGLAAEWKTAKSENPEPVIRLERDRQGRIIHVYVVWSRWAQVDRVERSEIVMDAAERVLPKDQALNILLAMGLTPDEARRMGMTI